ncbi:MAG: SufB/SufD family protein [Dissulfurimicrobium sp.]|uniref:SufB/SufD family protein n=1 Tax=Dissulfurimicrobium TaxID=1769732 RepID=UPI001EDB0967|nr:SufD family Fe-S cluster assembly protein [Dissulfurimicrobium hydrothermale]UKL13529.1 SufD family Fe-S cluster assembly protein [Dissulfurimicrobium hydrothermale]
MLDVIDRELLKGVADLEDIPKGAYNIRKNGKLLGRQVSANIMIETNEDNTGINIIVKPGTVNESVHIPVILSQADLFDVVKNNFIIGDGCDVTIIAGCGIHCGSDRPEGHAGIHEFRIGKGSKVKYVEKHLGIGSGTGKRTLNPVTRVFLEEGAHAELELTQIGGVDEAQRANEAELGPRSSILVTERVMTEGRQRAVSKNTIILKGEDSRAELISRSVIKGDSKQDFYAVLEARARSYGHLECDAIVMDNGTNETIPSLRSLHPDAELTHEAAIGKIANSQLMKLMSLGLTYDEAVNRIIRGFLR